MSDTEIRDAERAYRASGTGVDGEAWVQAVLRTTGLPSTLLIARVIENTRVIAALVSGHRPAVSRPVTPDDMVDFLRGGDSWRNHGMGTLPAQIPWDSVVSADEEIMRGFPASGVPAGSAILCNHANENPGHCPCEPDCYCRQDSNTCSDVERVYNDGRGAEPECRFCSTDARWRFKSERRLYACELHLAECRESRALPDAYVEMMRRSSEHMDSLTFPPPMPPIVRRCENCDEPLPTGHADIYCTNECAASDARP